MAGQCTVGSRAKLEHWPTIRGYSTGTWYSEMYMQSLHIQKNCEVYESTVIGTAVVQPQGNQRVSEDIPQLTHPCSIQHDLDLSHTAAQPIGFPAEGCPQRPRCHVLRNNGRCRRVPSLTALSGACSPCA